MIVKKDAAEAVNEYRAAQKVGKPITDLAEEYRNALGVEHYSIDVVSVLNFLRDQAHEDSKRWFPETSENLMHMVLCVCGEAGETANALKKGLRTPFNFDKAIEDVKAETIDVLIYLLNIWAILKVDVAHELAIKRAFNQERFGTKDAEV